MCCEWKLDRPLLIIQNGLQVLTIAILIANCLLWFLAIGHPDRLFVFTFLSQGFVVALALVKERSGWPFANAKGMWPIGVVGFTTGSTIAGLFNKNAADPELMVLPLLLAATIAAIGLRRRWWE